MFRGISCCLRPRFWRKQERCRQDNPSLCPEDVVPLGATDWSLQFECERLLREELSGRDVMGLLQGRLGDHWMELDRTKAIKAQGAAFKLTFEVQVPQQSVQMLKVLILVVRNPRSDPDKVKSSRCDICDSWELSVVEVRNADGMRLERDPKSRPEAGAWERMVVRFPPTDLSRRSSCNSAYSTSDDALADNSYQPSAPTVTGVSSHARSQVLQAQVVPTEPQAAMPTRLAPAVLAGDSAKAIAGVKLQRQLDERQRSEASVKKMPRAQAELNKLRGLGPVKAGIDELVAMVHLDRECGRGTGRDTAMAAQQYNPFNALFTGNQGTGKATVARIFAELLGELRVLPGSPMVETTGGCLRNEGVGKLRQLLAKLDRGGVLFIDDAYQLCPRSGVGGEPPMQVLDALVSEMKDRRRKLVVVMGGDQRQMDDLMGRNEGLRSCFRQEFNFPDFSDEELTSIYRDMVAAAGFTVEDERYLRIAARRLGRQRGTAGFGNARAVEKAFDQARRRQSARVLAQRRCGTGRAAERDPWLLLRDDLLGPRSLDVRDCKALRKLYAMPGLKSVKEKVENLLALVRSNAEREEKELPLQEVNLNHVFLGNPGTGKTTVAGLYGLILRDLGLLSKGDVVVHVPADFVGDHNGASERRTEEILNTARGNVLVIDEAYGLYMDGGRDAYRVAVVDTLVARVQGVPGDDRCVILLGYEEPMETMMRKANPGLARRFQLAEAWRFEDFGPEELKAITQKMAKKRGWQLSDQALQAAVEALEKERRRPNFGNAGAVQNLLCTVALRMEARLREQPSEQRATATPQLEDFLPRCEEGAAVGVFGDLIVCSAVRDKVHEWQAVAVACRARKRDPLRDLSLNMLFVGSPGTGKTTVASRVGRQFHCLDLLSSPKVHCHSASDFVTGYVDQAGIKTRERFKQAVGGVLFIDEAYRLHPKYGGSIEVVDEIVQLLTEPAFKDKMVVILAGYEHEMDELMSVNPGLKSRFSERLHFPDFTPTDVVELLCTKLRGYSTEIAPEAIAALPDLAGQLIAAPNWANGRDVDTWAKRAFAALSTRIHGQSIGQPTAQHTAQLTAQQQQQPRVPGGAAGPAAGDVEPAACFTLDDLRRSLQLMLKDKRSPTP